MGMVGSLDADAARIPATFALATPPDEEGAGPEELKLNVVYAWVALAGVVSTSMSPELVVLTVCTWTSKPFGAAAATEPMSTNSGASGGLKVVDPGQVRTWPRPELSTVCETSAFIVEEFRISVWGARRTVGVTDWFVSIAGPVPADDFARTETL
jgi:hypothetical protein